MAEMVEVKPDEVKPDEVEETDQPLENEKILMIKEDDEVSTVH